MEPLALRKSRHVPLFNKGEEEEEATVLQLSEINLIGRVTKKINKRNPEDEESTNAKIKGVPSNPVGKFQGRFHFYSGT